MSNTPDPIAGVSISPREIYDVLVRLTGRVDVLIAQHEIDRGEIKDHELRIRSLERNRWPVHLLTGMVALAALVLSILRNTQN
jgi:hypothetical protein